MNSHSRVHVPAGTVQAVTEAVRQFARAWKFTHPKPLRVGPEYRRRQKRRSRNAR